VLGLYSFPLVHTWGGMTGCPRKLFLLGYELPLGGFIKGHHPFPPYLSLFIIFALIHTLHSFGHWAFQDSKGLYLSLWEEGDKGLEGKSSWKKIKTKEQNLQMLLPRIPQKEIKGFSTREGGTHKIIKSRPSWRIGGVITSQPSHLREILMGSIVTTGHHARAVSPN
jgi:hypothetical protein